MRVVLIYFANAYRKTLFPILQIPRLLRESVCCILIASGDDFSEDVGGGEVDLHGLLLGLGIFYYCMLCPSYFMLP